MSRIKRKTKTKKRMSKRRSTKKRVTRRRTARRSKRKVRKTRKRRRSFGLINRQPSSSPRRNPFMFTKPSIVLEKNENDLLNKINDQ